MRQIFMLALVLVLGTGLAGAEDEGGNAVPPAKDPRFDFLKQLEGTWTGTGPGEAGESLFEFRVTAGGHAVEEREMIGTPMEMLTIYHMQGRDLVATHYCVLGNQPHLTAAKQVVDSTLAFVCDGSPGNTRSHDDEHVHRWAMLLDPDGKLHYSAELFKNGEPSQTPITVLTRTGTRASR